MKMLKILSTIISLFLFGALINGEKTLNSPVVKEKVTGECATDCHYSLDLDSGLLHIWGDKAYIVVHPWQRYSNYIKKVVISEGIRAIYSGSFEDSNNLTTVVIPDSVTYIGKGVFAGCPKLTCNFEGPVCYLGNEFNPYHALIGVNSSSSLYELTINNNTKVVAGLAVNCRTALTSLYIPKSVVSIGENAFEGCSQLQSVELPDSVTDIGEGAFKRCDSLRSVTLNTNYHVTDFKKAFPYSVVRNITLGTGVTSIGCDGYYTSSRVFYNCSQLVSISIPDTVTCIGKDAFAECKSLESITIPDLVEKIDESTFYGCSSLSSVILGESVKRIYEDAFMFCTSLKTISFSDSLTSIRSDAFHSCSSLESITLPSLSFIGDRAFASCSSLRKVCYSGINDPGESSSLVFMGTPMTYGKVDVPNNYNGTTFCGSSVQKGDICSGKSSSVNPTSSSHNSGSSESNSAFITSDADHRAISTNVLLKAFVVFMVFFNSIV